MNGDFLIKNKIKIFSVVSQYYAMLPIVQQGRLLPSIGASHTLVTCYCSKSSILGVF